MRISDGSSDVCSSDLEPDPFPAGLVRWVRPPSPLPRYPACGCNPPGAGWPGYARSAGAVKRVSKYNRPPPWQGPAPHPVHHPSTSGISPAARFFHAGGEAVPAHPCAASLYRSEEHTSELQSLMRISYAVFCLKKKKTKTIQPRKNIKRTQK